MKITKNCPEISMKSYEIDYKPPQSVFPRKIKTGAIYTMNVSEEMAAECGYPPMFNATEASLRMVLGSAETFCCYDTLQFQDYSKVVMEYMDPAKKAERREKVFPDDCRKAFEFGCRLASKQLSMSNRLLAT
jgi:hypothetical protein